MNSDSANRLPTPAPASGASTRPLGGFAVRFRDTDIPILKAELVVGRSAAADIVVDSSLVSRRHAIFCRLDEGGLVVEDLQSRNGTYVNGAAIDGRRALGVGDKVLIGDNELLIVEDTTVPRSRRVTATAARTQEFRAVNPAAAFAREERTKHSSAFDLLGGLVDKALALGHGAEAERLLASHLARLLVEAQGGTLPRPETAATAAGYALKLAAALGRPGWVDYAIKLYSELGTPLPMPLVDELFSLLRRTHGVDVPALKRYLEDLRAAATRLRPAERFVLQRLEGLLKIAR